MSLVFAGGLVVEVAPNLKPLLEVVVVDLREPKLNPVVDAGTLEELSTTPNLKPELVMLLESFNFLNNT